MYVPDHAMYFHGSLIFYLSSDVVAHFVEIVQ